MDAIDVLVLLEVEGLQDVESFEKLAKRKEFGKAVEGEKTCIYFNINNYSFDYKTLFYKF